MPSREIGYLKSFKVYFFECFVWTGVVSPLSDTELTEEDRPVFIDMSDSEPVLDDREDFWPDELALDRASCVSRG